MSTHTYTGKQGTHEYANLNKYKGKHMRTQCKEGTHVYSNQYTGKTCILVLTLETHEYEPYVHMNT